MDGDAVEIGNIAAFLFIELTFGMFLILFKKSFKVGVLRCAAEYFLVKLFYYLEIGDAENKKVGRVLSNEWRDDPL